MAKLTKSIHGAPDGEVYPREFMAGDDCPPSLVDYAKSIGALDTKAEKKAPENK